MTDDAEGRSQRTNDDLLRVVRSISRHFETDAVIIIGSQSILVDHPDAPAVMRTSGEIDAYPDNNRDWETAHPGELASEQINALFGIGSRFHQAHGFYIDGVDENTAKFPTDWRERATVREVKDGSREVKVIAPSIEDLIVSKLHRLDPKDKAFIRACHQMQPLNVALIQARLGQTEPETTILETSIDFLGTL